MCDMTPRVTNTRRKVNVGGLIYRTKNNMHMGAPCASRSWEAKIRTAILIGNLTIKNHLWHKCMSHMTPKLVMYNQFASEGAQKSLRSRNIHSGATTKPQEPRREAPSPNHDSACCSHDPRVPCHMLSPATRAPEMSIPPEQLTSPFGLPFSSIAICSLPPAPLLPTLSFFFQPPSYEPPHSLAACHAS